MSAFTRDEIEYLQSGTLGRLATVGRDGTPHVAPVGFSHNADLDTIDVGGRDMTRTKKYRDVARSGRAALVVDDVLPPWLPRGSGCAGGPKPSAGRSPSSEFIPSVSSPGASAPTDPGATVAPSGPRDELG